jgi:hypothetical protein
MSVIRYCLDEEEFPEPATFRLAGQVRYQRSDLEAPVACQEQATRRGGLTDRTLGASA